MQLTLGQPTAVQAAPAVATINVDSMTVDVNTGRCVVFVDDGGRGVSMQFTLPGATLTNLQTFVRNQLAAKLGTTVA